MLRRLLDYQLSLTEKGKIFHKIRPLIEATDTFLYEAPINTKRSPHIRDAVDIKRWMLLVVLALVPCIFMAIWNTGLQNFVYTSGDYKLMDEYLAGANTLQGYFDFAFKENRYLSILKEGFIALIPVVIIAYAVGGLCEALFAIVRGHEIGEGFLVTGILYALILPPTIPYWMVAVGVAAGVILGKEVFGGSGMNIVNPALACRAFLFFTFPGKMSGDVWVGTNPTQVRESLLKMNQEAHTNALDGYSQATHLARFNINQDIKRIHVDAIATNNLGSHVNTYPAIEKHFNHWNETGHHQATLTQMEPEQLKQFVTAPLAEGGLGLAPSNYEDAYHFASLNYGLGHNGDWNFFLGDKLGCMGETSVLACLIGALFLIWTGVGSWRTMAGMALGAFLTALLFQTGAHFFGSDGGAWNPAVLGFPAYKHLLLGGLAFGIVFMATDPVSSPAMKLSRWIYGALAGVVTIVIRDINPAYPEGVMLAILMANVFAPLIDYYVVHYYRKRSMRRARA
ncbi:Na(+)-transporting NADH-quinone reductase subunit B [Candidatus Protochlamydia phocaeensis]|uniref:Na(+)-transporting NADH-quinone reductase subunit B n=1 Tax=Candidatus Protochlamydia phocaeensis TaxID=1414722 RepID=UPI000837F729|nr:Na(+)-transporting NADH-quinone reductase subunit B [Candidatus Protochlamydia phocaeensis]